MNTSTADVWTAFRALQMGRMERVELLDLIAAHVVVDNHASSVIAEAAQQALGILNSRRSGD
tara:strand:+ start:613 stop:798 length:186 start_codon:yes stop_codon:yes gene_type:complete